MLEKLVYDEKLTNFDLSKTEPCDDRLMTKLILDDYDWMNYKFITYFPTKTQGFLKVEIEYYGSAESTMIVTQFDDNGLIKKHKYIFESELFEKFLIDFMTKHIQQWETNIAFCGEKEAVDIFNKVLDNYTDYEEGN